MLNGILLSRWKLYARLRPCGAAIWLTTVNDASDLLVPHQESPAAAQALRPAHFS